jgi:hypothetical protein
VRAFDPTADPERAVQRAARTSARLSAEVREVEAFLGSRLPVARGGGAILSGQIELDSLQLRSYPRPLRRALLDQAWRRVAPEGLGLTRAHLDAVDGLLVGARGDARIPLPGGHEARRDRGRLYMVQTREGMFRDPVRLSLPGQVECEGLLLRGRCTTGAFARHRIPSKSREDEFFAADGIEGGLEVRVGVDEERFVPFGRSRPITLGRFLSQQRVSRDPRMRPRILADARGILWVFGVRRAARAPVTAGTRRVVWVHARRHD